MNKDRWAQKYTEVSGRHGSVYFQHW